MTAPVEAALRRRRTITIAALALLALLAWGWLALGAGMGMAPRADLAMFGFPGDGGNAMAAGGMAAPAPPFAAHLLLVFSMWWVMMIAMMLPAAAPVILLYAKAAPPASGAAPPVAWFLAGYLAAWGLYSFAAALAQVVLQGMGLLAAMTMDTTGRWLAAAVLVAAGLYQLSPLKGACLSRCRNPAAFLSRHYRAGRGGAFRLGLLHGTWCVGCCWLLMALLFVGGVMNLAWIALLTLLVAGEKLLPRGRLLALASGAGFIAWGALLALA